MKPQGTPRLEHANLNVRDVDAVVAFLQTALPEFKVRGGGVDRNGRRWLHIGTDETYVALQQARPEHEPARAYAHVGYNHIGFVVDDAEAVRRRLSDAGYRIGSVEPERHRTRIYFYDADGTEYEFVEYLSDKPEERNSYQD